MNTAQKMRSTVEARYAFYTPKLARARCRRRKPTVRLKKPTLQTSKETKINKFQNYALGYLVITLPQPLKPYWLKPRAENGGNKLVRL